MGKAASRRRRHRRDVLTCLAVENPDAFHAAWSKRLESWAMLAREWAGEWADEDGNLIPAVFSLVDDAMTELAKCGEDAMRLQGDETRAIMMDACCRALAEVADPRMYRLSNMKGKYRPNRRGYSGSIVKRTGNPAGHSRINIKNQ